MTGAASSSTATRRSARDTGEREGEGETGLFGGDDPNDSSGVLSYLRVEFAGVRFTEEDELNGIALQGVGSGTVVKYVQVNRNADDGIEFFGGTVNAEYVLLTGIEDDSFDWTFGWNGHVANAVAWQGLAVADHGIEADNDQDVPDREPRSSRRSSTPPSSATRRWRAARAAPRACAAAPPA